MSFSIIIPLYNKEHSVEKTLRSVLDQTFEDFEIIVVDDGSTDGSAARVEQIRDSRLRLIRQYNTGVSGARNHGIALAEKEWLIFLDADDTMHQGALWGFANAISSHPDAQMIIGNFLINSDGQSQLFSSSFPDGIVKNPYKSWFFREVLPRTGAFACRTSLLKDFRFNTDLSRYEDAELLFRIFREKPVIYSFDQTVMTYQRVFSTASKSYGNIKKDFIGHLDFKNAGSLWESVCLYELYAEGKEIYPNEMDVLYPGIKRKFGLRFFYGLVVRIKNFKK